MNSEAMNKLTPREQEVAELLLEGLTSREVAARLYVSKRTIDFHCVNINEKLQVHNRVQLVTTLTRGGV
jgi:non-specific serine/threonine protein kinase